LGGRAELLSARRRRARGGRAWLDAAAGALPAVALGAVCGRRTVRATSTLAPAPGMWDLLVSDSHRIGKMEKERFPS